MNKNNLTEEQGVAKKLKQLYKIFLVVLIFWTIGMVGTYLLVKDIKNTIEHCDPAQQMFCDREVR